jgi:hypothetical protein
VFLLLIGVVVCVVFLCKKAFDNHKRINDLENQIEKLQQGGYKEELDNFTVGDETVVLRRKKKNEDSAIGDPSDHDSSIDSTVTILCHFFILCIKCNIHFINSYVIIGFCFLFVVFLSDSNNFRSRIGMVMHVHNLFLTQDGNCRVDTPNTQGLSEEGIFVHKTLTKYGGVLELLGIKLFVPSGALTEDTLITLGVTWRFSVYPKLSKSSAMLSPVVVCQPSIVFIKPVHLSFPHCAINHERDWTFTLFHRPNDIQSMFCAQKFPLLTSLEY